MRSWYQVPRVARLSSPAWSRVPSLRALIHTPSSERDSRSSLLGTLDHLAQRLQLESTKERKSTGTNRCLLHRCNRPRLQSRSLFLSLVTLVTKRARALKISSGNASAMSQSKARSLREEACREETSFSSKEAMPLLTRTTVGLPSPACSLISVSSTVELEYSRTNEI